MNGAVFSELVARRSRVWLKERRPNWPQKLFDKRQSWKLAEKHEILTPEKYDEYATLREIPDSLTERDRYVLKPARFYNSTGVSLVDNGIDLTTGESFDLLAYKKRARELGINGQRFVVEEFLRDWQADVDVPYDYKFYNFGTRVAFIHVVDRSFDTSSKPTRHWFIKPNGKPLNVQVQKSQTHSSDPLQRPPYFDEMMRQSVLISSSLDMFIRVDMYATDRGPVFGELTPAPHAGTGYTEVADAWLTSLWRTENGAFE